MSRNMFLLLYTLSLLIAVSFTRGQKENNVCPTLEDYRTIKNNKRCWYNPDVNAKAKTIAKRQGFILESHEVITPDGYILTLNRLVSLTGTVGSIPVMIHHGACANAALWMINGKTSIPFYLATAGYDVWLNNARGSEPSMRHVKWTPADPDFWDFSFHEIAILDIPVTLEFIRGKRGDKKKVTFIGHSMGGTIQFIYSAMRPDHAKENVEALISLAPAVYIANMKSVPASMLAPYADLIQQELSRLNLYGSGTFPQLKKLVGQICSSYPYISLCVKLLETITGRSDQNLDPDKLPLFFRRYPASFSVKTLVHYGQEFVAGGRFQMFNYGPHENLLRYNSTLPPEYNIEKVNVPTYILFGEADILSPREDNMKLYQKLKTEKVIIRFRGGNNAVPFQHDDFGFSKSLIDFDRFLVQLLRNIHGKYENKLIKNKLT